MVAPRKAAPNMSDSDYEDSKLLSAISDDATRLIHHLRCSKAPAEALDEAAGHIRRAMEILAPHLQQGDGWSILSIGSDTPGITWQEDDLTAVMPYSPISGKHNPIAPPIRMWKDGEQVRGEVVFSPIYAGPPDSVHGGIVAAVFDEILSMANVISGNAGFTGTLTVRYHRKTPLDTSIEIWGINERRDGRKQFSRGEMRVNGEVVASAEGLFICAPEVPRGVEDAT